MEFCISLRDSGDLVRDGFSSEQAAYEWLDLQHIDGEIDEFIIEKADEEEFEIDFFPAP